MLGAPDVLIGRGSLSLPVPLQRSLEAHTRRPGAGSSPSGAPRAACPDNPYSDPPPAVTPIALIVLEETLRPDARETIAYMRDQEMDLKLISGDAPQTVTAVASAVGIPAGAGVVTGDELPDDRTALARGRGGEHDLLPHPARAEEGAGLGPGGARPVRGDDRRRGQRRPGTEAGEDGGRDGLRAARSPRGSPTSSCSRTSSRGCRARLPRAAGSRATSTGSAAST